MTVEIGSYREPERGRPCEVQIYCDREGLASLITKLSRLKEAGDHIHLMSSSWGPGDLDEDKYVAENDLAHHLRISLI
ncbi:immunity protein 32 [Sneathiella sp. HT1-7]|nr:immunity protein 32 [Sneathiella sp. HT1-7]